MSKIFSKIKFKLVRFYKKIERKYVLESIFILGLSSLTFILPIISFSNDLGILVSATTSIFAILIGFYFSDVMANYQKLQSLIAEENSNLISIISRLHGMKSAENKDVNEMNNAIDLYLIKQLNSGTLEHVFYTEEAFDKIKNISEKIDMHSSSDEPKIGELVERMNYTRQETMLAGATSISNFQWVILYILSFLVLLTVLAIRDNTILMDIICFLMIFATQSVLIILRDIDNNRFLERKLAFRNPSEVFHALGLPPYYPEFSHPDQRIPNSGGLYRIGFFTDTGLKINTVDIYKGQVVEKIINYFGFGANATQEMMFAILGEIPKRSKLNNEFGYELLGYEICLQRLGEIVGDVAKEVIKKNWDDKNFPFESYFIRKNPREKVRGTIWELTPQQYKLVNNWELVSETENEGGLPKGEGMQQEEIIIHEHGHLLHTQCLLENYLNSRVLRNEHLDPDNWLGYVPFLGGEKFKEHIISAANQSRFEFEAR